MIRAPSRKSRPSRCRRSSVGASLSHQSRSNQNWRPASSRSIGAVAHDALDHIAAQHVVKAERVALRDWQFVRRDGARPCAGFGFVLHVAERRAPDRRDAEAEKAFGGVVRVALKIPVQPSLCCRARQADRWAARNDRGRSAHSRRSRALCAEASACAARSLPPGRALLVDHALVLGHPWHMRVAKQRDAIGPHFDAFRRPSCRSPLRSAAAGRRSGRN